MGSSRPTWQVLLLAQLSRLLVLKQKTSVLTSLWVSYILTLSSRLVFALCLRTPTHLPKFCQTAKHLFPLSVSVPNLSFACHVLSLQSSPRQTESGWTPTRCSGPRQRWERHWSRFLTLCLCSASLSQPGPSWLREPHEMDQDAVLALSQIILELKF